MLGVSLVVGWYLTLPLADRDGLPKETMANCYVVTALAALAGSRILYVATNTEEFKSVFDLFALRNGGLVAYGGFLGGLLGSWAFLAPKRIRLLAWADDAVPSLASGLLITRIGCYLFGCDFGTRLSDGAPALAQDAGHLPALGRRARSASGEGSPAYVRHLEMYRGTPLEQELVKMNSSFPVHPTQLYESLVGLLLLVLAALAAHATRASAGRSSSSSCSPYGFLRFLLELWRDDVERGSYGPTLDKHVYVPLCLLAVRGRLRVRHLARHHAGARPAGGAGARLRARRRGLRRCSGPRASRRPSPYQLSTSQLIGLLSALVVAYFYASFWARGAQEPELAMSLGDMASIRELRGEEPASEDDGGGRRRGRRGRRRGRRGRARAGCRRPARARRRASRARRSRPRRPRPPPLKTTAASPEAAEDPKGDPEPGTT